MPLNTSLTGPLFDVPHTPESASFLRSFERAQEQNSPLYLAQVQQAQKQVQELGFRMQKEQLDIELAKALQEDQLAGRSAVSEMARIGASAKDASDPSYLAAMYRVHAKNPTVAGQAFIKEWETRLKTAELANDRAEKLQLQGEAAAARVQSSILSTQLAGERIAATRAKAEADLTEKQLDRLRKEKGAKARIAVMTQQTLDKDKLLSDLNDQLSSAQADVRRYEAEQPSIIGSTGLAGRTKAKIGADLKAAMQSITELKKQISARENQLRQRMSILDDSEGSEAETAEPETESPSGPADNDPAGIRSLLAP